MSASPAFQFYPDDFLGGVSDMTQGEVGAYILLLCNQWNRGSIPVQPDRQRLLAKGDVSDHVLAKFRENEDGLLRNERLEKERLKQAQFRAAQRVKGQKSGESRRTAAEPGFNRGSTGVQPGHEPRGNRKATLLSPISDLRTAVSTSTGEDFISLIPELHQIWQERTGLEAKLPVYERDWYGFLNVGWRKAELELVIEHSKVLNKGRDEQYHAPLALGKLIDPRKFADRLQEAQAWEKAGRPLDFKKAAGNGAAYNDPSNWNNWTEQEKLRWCSSGIAPP